MIRLEGVTWTYEGAGRAPALDNVSLEIGKGETVILAGVSGCGKTTITRLINGLIPDCYHGTLEGKITVDGKDPAKEKTVGMSYSVGSVFQNPKSQFFNINSRNELAFPLENRNVPADEILRRIDGTAGKLRMEHLVGRNMFRLSGGEKQKIAFASVALSGQDVLVLDEPSSNLDMEAVRDLRSILEIWKSEGKTIVISEHRFFFLEGLADRLVLMDGGKIEHVYEKDELRRLSPMFFHDHGLRSFSLRHEYGKRSSSVPGDYSIMIDRLYFRYRDSEHGINIENIRLRKGAVTAIIGHNGAGKSTFLRCLAGLEKTAGGDISVDGEKVKLSGMLARTTMVMQDVNHQLFTDSAENELMHELRRRKVPKEERAGTVSGWLRRIGLEGQEESHPMSLSGGQKQRLAIAAAALSGKDIILFDEPTSGLDYLHMKDVAVMIRELAGSGRTVILVSHDLDLLMETADDVLVLEDGKAAERYALAEETSERLNSWFEDLFSEKPTH